MEIKRYKSKKKKGGREADWKCVYCGRFVAYDDPDVVVDYNMLWDWHREEPYEETDMYHKKCKAKIEKLREAINKQI